MTETYISVDIEANGPIPGDYSMLSLGAAAFTRQDGLVSTFSANIEPLPGASQDPDTMKWWSTQPHAWAAVQHGRVTSVEVMTDFYEWQKQFKNPVFLAWPLSFEAMFVGYYLHKFAGRHPFELKWVDFDSYAAAVLKCDITDTRNSPIPKRWEVADKHTHVAVEDAIEQGRIFMKIVKEAATVDKILTKS